MTAAIGDAPLSVADDGPEALNPKHWPIPKGYANGMMAEGRIVVTGGIVGWDEAERFPQGFAAQARQALDNIRAILAEGGAEPRHLVRLTWYVTDRAEYVAARREIGRAYRETVGEHYPPRSVVVVAGLLEERAKVEIEATAVVPA